MNLLFEVLEKGLAVTRNEVKAVDSKVESVASSVSELLAGIAALGTSQKETQGLVKGLKEDYQKSQGQFLRKKE